MDEKKTQQPRPDQRPPQHTSPKPDPRQDEPRWNDRHPQAPLRDIPQERGDTTPERNKSDERDEIISGQSER